MITFIILWSIIGFISLYGVVPKSTVRNFIYIALAGPASWLLAGAVYFYAKRLKA